MEFNYQLKKLMESRGVSSPQLASELGISRQTVWHWLTGEAQPGSKSFKRLARFFKLSDIEFRRLMEMPSAPKAEAIDE